MGKPAQIVHYQGCEHRLIDLCERMDRDPMLVRQRLRSGWDLDKALTTESNGYGGKWKHYQEWLARRRIDGLERNRTGGLYK